MYVTLINVYICPQISSASWMERVTDCAPGNTCTTTKINMKFNKSGT